MESNVKDQLNKYLELYNDKNNLEKNITLLKPLQNKGLIGSMKSALIGKIYGGAMGFFITINLRRQINSDIVDEFNDIFYEKISPVNDLLEKMLDEK
jgi:hypothetical protein